jgi:hypothetical protein
MGRFASHLAKLKNATTAFFNRRDRALPRRDSAALVAKAPAAG